MIKINLLLLVAILNIGAMEQVMNTSVQLPSAEILKTYLDKHNGYLSVGINLHEKFGGKVASPGEIEDYLWSIESKRRDVNGIVSNEFLNKRADSAIMNILKLAFQEYPKVLEELTRAGRFNDPALIQ